MEKEKKGLSTWQLTMMALGTVIGGSFFVGSSIAINAAGPSILIPYIIGGILIYFILTALSEMTVANPDSGSFRTFASQTFGKGVGFIVGWVYWTGMVLAMSSEATAVSILIRELIPRHNCNNIQYAIYRWTGLWPYCGNNNYGSIFTALYCPESIQSLS